VVFGLVLGGALGNLTDRVVRSPGFLRGHVIDFLHLTHWPVFNVADSAFTVAAVLVALLVLRDVPLEGTGPGPERPGG
jgi:signal peptidase II